MKILFYSPPIINSPISYSVHINEVLNHISSFGHEMYYANGQRFHTCEKNDFIIRASASKSTSWWIKIRTFVAKTLLSRHAPILLTFIMEIELFFMSLKTGLINKPDIIYSRHGLFNSEYFLSKLLRIPLVREINGIVIDEARIHKSWDNFSLKLIDILERKNIRKADKYIAVTSKLRTTLCKDYGIAEDKITVIENGANIDLFKPIDPLITKRQLCLDKSISYVCFVGVLYPWQGVEYLIKAMQEVIKTVPNAKLLIVGDGIMKSELLQMTKDLNIETNVVLTGRVPYNEVPLYINSSDICVAPFVRQRNERIGLSPLKLCEYLACKVPVVATDIPGVSDTIRTSQGGICVAPDDAEQLSAAIIKLLLDEDLRLRMGENGYKYVIENRSWKSVAKKVEMVFIEAVEARKKA